MRKLFLAFTILITLFFAVFAFSSPVFATNKVDFYEDFEDAPDIGGPNGTHDWNVSHMSDGVGCTNTASHSWVGDKAAWGNFSEYFSMTIDSDCDYQKHELFLTESIPDWSSGQYGWLTAEGYKYCYGYSIYLDVPDIPSGTYNIVEQWHRMKDYWDYPSPHNCNFCTPTTACNDSNSSCIIDCTDGGGSGTCCEAEANPVISWSLDGDSTPDRNRWNVKGQTDTCVQGNTYSRDDYDWNNMTQDEWMDITVCFFYDWDNGSEYLKVWENGTQIVNRLNNEVGYNDYEGMYWLIGLYIGQYSSGDGNVMKLWFDEFRIAEWTDAKTESEMIDLVHATIPPATPDVTYPTNGQEGINPDVNLSVTSSAFADSRTDDLGVFDHRYSDWELWPVGGTCGNMGETPIQSLYDSDTSLYAWTITDDKIEPDTTYKICVRYASWAGDIDRDADTYTAAGDYCAGIPQAKCFTGDVYDGEWESSTFTTSSSSTAYYVNCDLSECETSCAGTYGDPFIKISQVNNKVFSTGDDVYFKNNTVCDRDGTVEMDARLIIDWGGTAGNYAIIGCYESEGDFDCTDGGNFVRPILDGKFKTSVVPIYGALVSTSATKSYIKIKDLHLKRSRYSSIEAGVCGSLGDTGQHIYIDNIYAEQSYSSNVSMIRIANGAVTNSKIWDCGNWPTGTHTGADNQSTLTDSTKSSNELFIPNNNLVGDWIKNGTKSAAVGKEVGCTITANTSTTVTCTLKDPQQNVYDWDYGDWYYINTGGPSKCCLVATSCTRPGLESYNGSCNNITFARNLVYWGHNEGLGIYRGAADVTAENNVIMDNNGPGIYVSNSYNATVRNNLVYASNDSAGDWNHDQTWGIYVFNEEEGQQCPDCSPEQGSGHEVYGNLIAGEIYTAIRLGNEVNNSRLLNVKVYNNTIVGVFNGVGVGIGLSYEADTEAWVGVEIKNNLLTKEGTSMKFFEDYNDCNTSGVTWSDNLYSSTPTQSGDCRTNNEIGDPLLAKTSGWGSIDANSLTGREFIPLYGGAGIDKGLSIASYNQRMAYTDFTASPKEVSLTTNAPYGTLPDIGAFEYALDSAPTSLALAGCTGNEDCNASGNFTFTRNALTNQTDYNLHGTAWKIVLYNYSCEAAAIGSNSNPCDTSDTTNPISIAYSGLPVEGSVNLCVNTSIDLDENGDCDTSDPVEGSLGGAWTVADFTIGTGVGPTEPYGLRMSAEPLGSGLGAQMSAEPLGGGGGIPSSP